MKTGAIISRSDLEPLIKNGSIDTVIVGFPDLQGRLVGKRITEREEICLV